VKDGLGSLLILAVKFKVIDINKTHLVNRSQILEILPFIKQQHLDYIFK